MLGPSTLYRNLLLLAILCMPGPLPVYAQPAAEPDSVESAVSPAPDDDAETREKRKRVTVGVLALLGITLAGIALLAFVIIWGRRLRRISHQPYPEVRSRDELWYLKPDKKSLSADKESSTDEPAADDDVADDRTDVS